MTADERAEALIDSERGMDVIRHCDASTLQEMIAAVIREAVLAERAACAELVRHRGHDLVKEVADGLLSPWGVHRLLAEAILERK